MIDATVSSTQIRHQAVRRSGRPSLARGNQPVTNLFANRLQAAIVSEHLDAFPDPVRAASVLPFGTNELSDILWPIRMDAL
jgi:hypothetical protein